MTDLHARIERLIAHLEEENRALERLLESGQSLAQADRALRGPAAETTREHAPAPGRRRAPGRGGGGLRPRTERRGETT